MLNKFLEENGFTKLNKYVVSNGGISVGKNIDGEPMVLNNKDLVIASNDESKVIEAITDLLNQRNNKESNEAIEAQETAKLVAQDSDMKYYADENKRGQTILIKDIVAKLGKEIPKSVGFAEFQKLVESNI